MGFSFHSADCVKRAKEYWNESHTINGRRARQRPKKTRRVEAAGLTVLSRYEYESAIDQDGSRTRLTNIRSPSPPALTGGLSVSSRTF
jgi:hypothetical protein